MRNIWITSTGFLLLLLTQTAHAQCTPDPILTKNPVSFHYVEEILDRADKGIVYANSFPSGVFSNTYFFGWWHKVQSAAAMLIDTDLRIVERERNLRNQTACLHADLRLLEAKMEQVQCELDEAFEDVRVMSIRALIDLKIFLNERYDHLVKGAKDPNHVDTGIDQYRLFDDLSLITGDVWCCNEQSADPDKVGTCNQQDYADCWFDGGVGIHKTQFSCLNSGIQGCSTLHSSETPSATDERMCPFTTDYLPPTTAGYGCDTEVLDPFRTIEPMKTEYDALDNIFSARNTFITNMSSLEGLTNQLNALLKKEPINIDDYGHSLIRAHVVDYGCLEQIMERLGRTPDAQGRYETNIIDQLGATRESLRGPFSLQMDEPKILLDFLRLRKIWGKDREFADYLKKPVELSLSPTTLPSLDIFSGMVQIMLRYFMEGWSMSQYMQETMVIAKASDQQLQLKGIFDSLRTTNKDLSELASDLERGPRSFTRGLAWFLRRSCFYRPCNTQLERILRVVLTDSCFPYTDGSYHGSSDVHTKCVTDAGDPELGDRF